jgi:hypothetical protein
MRRRRLEVSTLCLLKMGSKLDLAGIPLDPDGLKAAAAGVGAPEADEVEQADLFGSSPLAGLADDPATLFPQLKRGRPPGARNKSTEEWRAFMHRQYRSPLLFLADLVSLDPKALRDKVMQADRDAGVKREISLMDVLQLQRQAAEALAPYLHRKQPIAIDAGEGQPLPYINMIVAGAEVLGQHWGQGADKAKEFEPRPLPAEDEVAAEQSHGSADND